MQELLYWMLAQAPSNIFVLLMMEDLCHRTLVPVRRTSEKYTLSFYCCRGGHDGCRPVSQQFSDDGGDVCLYRGVDRLLYARERPYIRLVMAGVFCPADFGVGYGRIGLWSAGRMIGYNGGNPLVCQAIGGTVFPVVGVYPDALVYPGGGQCLPFQ